MTEEELKQIMQNDSKTWFTLNNLSTIAKQPESDIQKIIKNSNLFVQSSSLNANGENLFSTKDDFRAKESFTNKILGAFKNRID